MDSRDRNSIDCKTTSLLIELKANFSKLLEVESAGVRQIGNEHHESKDTQAGMKLFTIKFENV